MSNFYFLSFLVVFMLNSINVFGAAKVIAVVGQTQDASQYIRITNSPNSPNFSNTNKIKLQNPKEASKIYYHISSKELTPGSVEKRTINLPDLPKPIFIIGDDDFSMQWLDKYADALRKAGAIGFIVQLKDFDTYKSIKDKYRLNLFPKNGDALAKKFQVKHYPVLISKNLIEQ
jgi:integrating conjugative element protein (TIGR03765 family)